MPRSQHQGYRIVCGVDLTDASREAVREAQRLSKRVAGSELHFVHALDRPHADLDSSESQSCAEHTIARLEDYVQSVLFDVNVSLSELRAVFHVRLEDPQSALVNVARDEHADVIIVGASERGRLSQLWRRWGVRRFMQRAPVPVLVAHERKPEIESKAIEPKDGGSGVYTVVGGRRLTRAGQSLSPLMDGDSTSTLCRMYEARASQPDLPARACPSMLESQRRLGTAR